MTDQPASDRQTPTAKEPAARVYLEGFDDPTAQVVLHGSDGVALRVHDYYLKASRLARLRRFSILIKSPRADSMRR
jgi:hypothetical protein